VILHPKPTFPSALITRITRSAWNGQPTPVQLHPV